ncbi:MAG: hypothetical protein AAF985_17060 [Bacteroidota bacterium]
MQQNKPRVLPKVIVSSVIRSSQKGESHGGIYLVDLERETTRQVYDWNDPSISWEGRGGDRGLRGIAFYGDDIYLAGSDELFCFDLDFKIKATYRNHYLKHVHEISVDRDRLLISSTGFDSILTFDLQQKAFVSGLCFRRKLPSLKNRVVRKLRRSLFASVPLKYQFDFFRFDPLQHRGPSPQDTIHLNNVFTKDDALYFSGTGMNELVRYREGQFDCYALVPRGTHNVQFVQAHLLYNDTPQNRVVLQKGEQLQYWLIPSYQPTVLKYQDLPKDHARQAFGRGLCTFETWIIGGSSPATITVYSLAEEKIVKSINLSNDIRNAIHGLEIWPF